MISICIPAYKNDAFVTRLLDSICDQTFRDFEVIVTDDSPDNLVELACKDYESKFSLQYFRNSIPLGSPANWNCAILKAKGEWIKMMHHDDWFSQKESLYLFHKATLLQNDLIFSAFTEVEGSSLKLHAMTAFQEKLLRKSPYNLFKKNFIGHPSTTLIRNRQTAWYDENIKWVVDFEFYIRHLNNSPKFTYLQQSLVNIGISDTQITKSVFRNNAVEIPENLYLINKIGAKHLRNIYVCDYYWRLFRNMNIRKLQDLKNQAGPHQIPDTLKKMVNFQSNFQPRILRIGIISKILMLSFYTVTSFD